MTALDQAEKIYRSFPTTPKNFFWSRNVQHVAKLVKLLRSVPDAERAKTINALADRCGFSAGTIRLFIKGHTTSNKPWYALQELLGDQPAATPPPAQSADATPAGSGSRVWRLDDQSAFHITETSILPYGTPEHAAFLREVMPQLVLSRPT